MTLIPDTTPRPSNGRPLHGRQHVMSPQGLGPSSGQVASRTSAPTGTSPVLRRNRERLFERRRPRVAGTTVAGSTLSSLGVVSGAVALPRPTPVSVNQVTVVVATTVETSTTLGSTTMVGFSRNLDFGGLGLTRRRR